MNSEHDKNCNNSKNFESKRKLQMVQTQRHTMTLAANGTKN